MASNGSRQTFFLYLHLMASNGSRQTLFLFLHLMASNGSRQTLFLFLHLMASDMLFWGIRMSFQLSLINDSCVLAIYNCTNDCIVAIRNVRYRCISNYFIFSIYLYHLYQWYCSTTQNEYFFTHTH